MNTNAVTILLVDDDEVDAEAVQRGFRKCKIANPFVVTTDGLKALEILRNGLPRPFLILLDLNMPRMNGIEFLKELRADPRLRNSIVFILTTSDDARDRWDAYHYNVAGYLVKSKAGKDFINLVDTIDHYWRFVEFPPDRQP